MEQSSFDIADIASAKEAFSRWQAKSAEEIDDYIIRQRKSELSSLVKKVIDNELSEQDRLLLRLHWYKGLTGDEIAAMLKIGRSTVYRRLEKISGTIYDKLKYAVEYRYGRESTKAAMLIIKSAPSVAEKFRSLGEIGGRLFLLRESQQLTAAQVSDGTGIGEKRLLGFEKNEETLTVRELRILSEFYRVSSDYIIFGSHRVVRNPLTGMPAEIECKKERL